MAAEVACHSLSATTVEKIGPLPSKPLHLVGLVDAIARDIPGYCLILYHESAGCYIQTIEFFTQLLIAALQT